jgi:hypothetical protein
MAIDVLCLTEEQQQNLNELLKACRFLVEVKRMKMADSAIAYGIDQIAAVIRKIDKVAA